MNLHTLLIDLKVFKMELIDVQGFLELLFRFSLNTGILMLLVRWLYYSTSRRKDYLFTFMIIGSIVFLLCYLLGGVKVQIGFALGLFAIFGIIRYRTDQIPIKEMTYLFLVVAISAVNGLANKKISILEIAFSNLAMCCLTFGFEKLWLLKHESVKDIVYEKIDLIKPERHSELLADLQKRTGIYSIKRVEVGKIDFLRDTCLLKIYYEEAGREMNMADNQKLTADNGDDD
jgi:hypothetical protein